MNLSIGVRPRNRILFFSLHISRVHVLGTQLRHGSVERHADSLIAGNVSTPWCARVVAGQRRTGLTVIMASEV